MGDFKNLFVWQKAHDLSLDVRRVALRIRATEDAALRNQMIRAAQSVAANIVEGRAQSSEREFRRFLGYSIASASELEHHLIVASDIGAISDSDFRRLTDKLVVVRKMLHGLQARLDG